MKSMVTSLLLLLIAVVVSAQKGPIDELGFRADRLYNFTNVDSVNLFNGNLTISIPLGVEYTVGSALSYQFTLVYNGKVWDTETYDCADTGQAGGTTQCTKYWPSLRSNAGLGWRVSLGRLLPPYDTGNYSDSFTDLDWVYEGPSGDEHSLGPSSTAYLQTNVHDGLRMRFNTDGTRDVESASGEVHHFVQENSVWRLKQIRDRFGNAVNISYVYSADGTRELQWNVSDTAGRTHTVNFITYTSMSSGWSRGQNVSSMDLQAVGGARAAYTFGYTTNVIPTTCTTISGTFPALTSVTLPDTTQFTFSNFVDSSPTCSLLGTVSSMSLPTGGTISYTMGQYLLAPQTTICSGETTVGVVARTVNDGSATRQWKYLQQLGPSVPLVTSANQRCGAEGPYGPFYWSRTSVLAPVDDNNQRTRSDHYFSVFDGERRDLLVTPLKGYGLDVYSHSGTVGAPSASIRRAAIIATGYLTDGDAVDDSANPQRLLATETYDQCDSTGDCTNGTLLQSTYDRHVGIVDPGAPYHPIDDVRLLTSRRFFENDSGCGGKCYTQFTNSDDNGAEQYRTTTTESNFPGAQTVTTTVHYPTWTASDLTSSTREWLLQTYSEKARTEGGVTRRETFCFDNTNGSLSRHRVLAGSAPGSNDVLRVYSYDSHGNVQFSYDYGGDAQALDTGADVCTIPLPSQPSYKVENTYTNGVLATSRYYDLTSGQPFGYFSIDRTIDPSTGVVTAGRDTAGVATSYSYDPLPARLHTMTSPAGAVTTYTYTPASGTAGGSLTLAKVDAATTATAGSLGSQWVFDGLGRVVRKSSNGPSAWSASQTAYDQEGRVASVSEPESTGSGPPSGSLTATNKTSYKYDALGRKTLVSAPDGSQTTFDYTGARLITRKATVWTGSSQTVPVIEEYDLVGRLISVTQKSGPTSASSVSGSDIVAAYSYDAGNLLSKVTMKSASGTGAIQTRSFDHDGRGFLRWESQPESGMTSYTYDARGHVLSESQSAASSQFDLNYSYDSAERLTEVDGRNPLYNPGDPSQPQFRSLKEFTYGSDNGTFSAMREGQSITLTDRKRGKLVSATRHNYGETAQEEIYDVQDVYHYGDAGGHKTDRTTTITKRGAVQDTLPITTSVLYNDLELPSTISYPMCDGCGAPASDPDRSNMTRTYSAGRLTGLSNFVSSTSFWPNGMRNVLSHANRIDDTQWISNMSRPSQIAFGTATRPYDKCVRPSFTPRVPTIASTSGGNSTLSVTIAGTPPFTYDWWALTSTTSTDLATHPRMTSTTDSVTVSPAVTTTYQVAVSNPCGFEYSDSIKLDASSCPAPSVSRIDTVHQPDGSWTLKAINITASNSPTFTWLRLPDNVVMATTPTLTLGVLSTTTTYKFTVNDECGSGSRQVTVSVPLPITAGLTATATQASAFTQVVVTWPAISGATQYTIYRRSLGGSWEQAGTSTTPSFTDTTAAPSRTYVYRVTSDNGGQTDYDVATTRSFTTAVSGQMITPAPMDSMLDAVNSVRAAAGWPAVTWANILAASDPLPQPGQLITARQLMACRERMNEALEALGVTVLLYTDPDVTHLPVKALYINEVEQRAQ